MRDVSTKITRLQRIKDCFVSLSSESIAVCKYPSHLKRAILTFSIIKILQHHKELLDSVSLNNQNNLLAALKNYGQQALKIFKQQQLGSEETSNFTSLLEQLVSHLQILSMNNKLDDITQSFSMENALAENFVEHCCGLIAEDNKYQDSVNNLQMTAIIVNVDNLILEQKHLILKQLLLIKELWQIDSIETPKGNKLLLFHAKIFSILKVENSANHQNIFAKIANVLINDCNILVELSNIELIYLYNKLKDLCTNCKTTHHILITIYNESIFRNSCHKFNHSSYELLKLFEDYNVIIQKINNSEFAIVEKFMLRKKSFLHEILIHITKHIDLIIILNMTEDSNLNYILTQIRTELTKNIHSGSTLSIMISAIESKFPANFNHQIVKRYTSLDNFAKHSLKIRYQLLFNNIASLLKNEPNLFEFVQQIIIHKIAIDYRINCRVESVEILRRIEQQRLEVIDQLSEINFMQIFNEHSLNKISSFNFRKRGKTMNETTPSAYVKAIIRTICSIATAEQLLILLQLLVNSNFSKIQNIVEQELSVQMTKRTTIARILYYIFTGKKNELTLLKKIKQSFDEYLQTHNAKNIAKI